MYRGVYYEYINLNEYKINSVHLWPNLTSTTKNISKAYEFGRKKKKKDKCVLFEIYVN